MNLYLVKQDLYEDETWVAMIVAAETELEAIMMRPDGKQLNNYEDCWISIKDIEFLSVRLIGATTEPKGVILASYRVVGEK